MDLHNKTLATLSAQVAQFHRTQTPFRIYHGSTNSTRPSVRTASATLDTSSLNHVISIDTDTQTCLVEPNVPMDALVAATLQYGLVPPVVPEFPGITVGGGFAGTAGESSSFKYGFFDRAVNWLEMVLADGEIVITSEKERSDLFHGSAGTFGTLGVATLFELRLIPAKKYVELQYVPVKGIVEAQKVMEEVVKGQSNGGEMQREVDFLDGIMYAPDRGVIMVGRFTDGIEYGSNEEGLKPEVVTFTKAWDEWFYLHAESRIRPVFSSSSTVNGTSKSRPPRDLIPLTDYLFRYDRGAFWTGKYAYWYFCTPFNRYTRWALDVFMHTRTMYHALHRSGLMQRFIIQDMAVPNDKMEEFSDWLDNEVNDIYPRWLCPLRQNESVSMHPHSAAGRGHGNDLTDGQMLLNVGVWGWSPPERSQIDVNRTIEGKLRDLHGMKWLYAQAFYTKEEFWSIYDQDWYDGLRRKYKAESLPNVYDKVVTKLDPRNDISKGIWSIWPLTGLYGVLSTLKGGDYLRKG